jgi:hypothetical protein
MVATVRSLRVVRLQAAAAAAELFCPVRRVPGRAQAHPVALAAFAVADVVGMLATMRTARTVQAAMVVVVVVLTTSSVGSWAPALTGVAMVNSAAVAVAAQVMADMADSAVAVAPRGIIPFGLRRMEGTEGLEGAAALAAMLGLVTPAKAAISAAERTRTTAAAVEH